tara:strand:- start:440 stop:1729 length:1290 start_codon:yes stop_codon:yes gene_type:complete
MSQSIQSYYHHLNESKKILYDTGHNWDSLTIFGSQKFILKPQKKSKKQTSFSGSFRFNTLNQSLALSGYGLFRYGNYFCFVNPLIIDNSKQNQMLTPFENLKHYYDSFSGVGFANEWAIVQIGRNRESWGSGDDIQLALSNSSATYDYLLLGSNYGHIRVRYIYGFLENVNGNINRYITARGIEWTNKKTLIIGFSETVIYSGINRSFDFGYINPISSHLEIELNNRLNTIGDKSSNAVWQMHLDLLVKNNFRISTNFLIDEFVLDPDIEIRKEHGKAYSIRFAHTLSCSRNGLITLYSSIVSIGTPTFRHKRGTNNFVQKGKPLGWYGGSDSEEICIGVKYFNNKRFALKIATGFLSYGEETIIQRAYEPYADYQKGKFPSGTLRKSQYLEINFIFWRGDQYSVSSSLLLSENFDLIDIAITLPIYLP